MESADHYLAPNLCGVKMSFEGNVSIGSGKR